MAHFAEIDSNNIVLRVVVIDNNDVNASGGDQSVGAEEKVKSIVPFTSGNRWVQTSYNNNFRKQYAGIGYTFDAIKNKFISPQPFASWSLDANDDWQAPVAYPTVTTYGDNVNTLFRGMKLDKDGLVKTIKTTNSLGHLTLPLGLLQATKEF
jgi:hypothetical protein